MSDDATESTSNSENKSSLNHTHIYMIETLLLYLSIFPGKYFWQYVGSAYLNLFILLFMYVSFKFAETEKRARVSSNFTIQLWWFLIALIDLIVCFIAVRLRSYIFIFNIFIILAQGFVYGLEIEYEAISELYIHSLVNIASLSIFLFVHKNTFLSWWFFGKLMINLSCYLYILFYTFPIKLFNEYRSLYDKTTVPSIDLTGNHATDRLPLSITQWKRKIDCSVTPANVMESITKDVLLIIITRGRDHRKYFDIFTSNLGIPVDILANLPYKLLKRINRWNSYSILERLAFSTEIHTLPEHISDYLLQNISRSSKLFFRISYRDLYPKRIALYSIPPVRISPFVDFTNHDWATLKLTKYPISPEKSELMNRKFVSWWMMI